MGPHYPDQIFCAGVSYLKNALHSIASTTREQKEWIIQKRQIKLNAYPERLEWYCSLTFTSIILSFSKPVSLMHTGLHTTHTHTHSHIHTRGCLLYSSTEYLWGIKPVLRKGDGTGGGIFNQFPKHMYILTTYCWSCLAGI